MSVFQLFGGVIIGIGVWAFVEKNKYYQKDISTVYDVVFDLSIIFLIIGSIIFILGYAGCIGALRENVCLLKIVSIYIYLVWHSTSWLIEKLSFGGRGYCYIGWGAFLMDIYRATFLYFNFSVNMPTFKTQLSNDA